jgi:tRNA-specific 2-thiouridylase
MVGLESELYRKTVIVEDINLIACDSLEQPLRATAKHRYRSTEKLATVHQIDEERLEVVFDVPQKAITRGQALVIYHGDDVIGGGTITNVW